MDAKETTTGSYAMASSSNQRPYQGYPYVDPPVVDVPSISRVSTKSQHRPYQGYPYVDPPVIDAPSISADDAVRWNNLPRKQVELNVKREAPTPEDIPLQERVGSSLPAKRSSDAPVVYIDLPSTSGGGSAVADRSIIDDFELQERVGSSLPAKRNSDAPVVYIDLPTTSAGGSAVADRSIIDDFEVIERESQSSSSQSKSDPAPVVYIDLPEENGSDVAQSRENSPQTEAPEFVQETIFYNPFDNKRIDQTRDEDSDESEDPQPQVPARRPNTLDLNGPGTSGSTYTSSSGMSSLMSKQAEIYARTDSNGFPASPIPVSQFPEPPPAYAEIDNVSSPIVGRDPVVEQPRDSPGSPPRTQVILPGDGAPPTPTGTPNPDRKYLNCHHCGMRVHTLVIRENGTITHGLAFGCLLICVLPAVAFMYCTDHFKVKNHYCPNCNKIIGYELPLRSNRIIYVD